MLAIIRTGNKKYYTSPVFGYFTVESHSEDEYQRYLDGIYNRFYIVFDERKTTLIKQPLFDRKSKHLTPLVLIADCSDDEWKTDEDGNGHADYIDSSILLPSFDYERISDKIIARCRYEDAKIKYREYQTVQTQNDLKNLDRVSGNFHDAYIKEFREENDSLYILFDGIWGCQIELWFEGNVSYSIESRYPDADEPYWYDSTLRMNDNEIVLVDREIAADEEIGEGYCWFKGNKLKYHIIPI